ncbi:tyrosine-type recombinase/integrase [Neoaquamicrobium sediminum]|uniref:tyrosine-type recombinase/integrase n=1 Tax=Neoaquamicrobium sediminum TaxID=1849104 RepID=UPI00406BD884
MLKLHDELITELSNSLTTQNYNPVVVANHRLYARAFLDYLAECDIQVETVTPQQVDQYFGYAVQDFEIQYGRPPSARWHMLPRTAIAKLLRLAQGNWPPDAEMIGPDDEHRHEICREYEAWLREERGLASASIAALMWEARNFLRWQFDRAGAASLETLSIVDIDLYMDMRAPGLRRKSLADVAERLRSVVRHLHRTGRIPTDLTPHIIGPMLYAYEDVPSTLERSQIAAVLATTQEDRSPRGLRDYAILQLLATYGLREGEICRLRLDDVDWRAESLRICHTKTNAYSYMPLMVTVGEALLDYLRLGRPQVEVREIFVRSCAPYIAMTNLYGMIRGRLAAAGVVPAGKRGPHVFRHARAVEMLRASVPQRSSATCSGIDPPNPPILISNWQQMISEPWHSRCLEWRCCHERLARSRSHRRRRLPGKIAVPAGKRTDISLVPLHLRRCCPPASGGGPADARRLAEGDAKTLAIVDAAQSGLHCRPLPRPPRRNRADRRQPCCCTSPSVQRQAKQADLAGLGFPESRRILGRVTTACALRQRAG